MPDAVDLRTTGTRLRHRAAAALAMGRSWLDRTFIRYCLVTAVNVVVGEVILFGCYMFAGLSPIVANWISAVIAAVPAYLLSRRWVWPDSDRKGLVRQTSAFWALALVSLAASSAAVEEAGRLMHHVTDDRAVVGIVIVGAAIGSYGVLWLVRYVVLDRLVFTGARPQAE